MAMYFKGKKGCPVITKVSEKPDMLQSRVDETKSCAYLFYNYSGNNKDCAKNLDTSNVTNMNNMFSGCSKLTSLDISGFDTSNVTNMTSMFNNCSKLTSLDVSNFNTSNVTHMDYMFNNCSKLTSLDISSFDFTNVTSYNNMFIGVRDNCEILVKDETAKEWITSKFTNLTS